MSVVEAESILSISSDGVAAFIRDQASSRSLSPLMRQLNDDLLSGDPSASEMAARVLRHLGFLE